MSREPAETVKVTHVTEFFMNAVEAVVEQLCANPQDLRPYIKRLAGSLRLNELELVAWMFVLKKALYGEMQDRQLKALQFSAYLSKSLMCRNADFCETALRKEDAHFQDSYPLWLASHSRCAEMNVRDLHAEYREMCIRGKKREAPENLNRVVDFIVQAKTETKVDALELPLNNSFEGLLTPNFPAALPPSDSPFQEATCRQPRLFNSQ